MKRFFIPMLCAGLAFASCTKDRTEEPPRPVDPTIELGEGQMRATLEEVVGPQTRSHLDQNGAVAWSLGDIIGVATPDKLDANLTYTMRSEANLADGIFDMDGDAHLTGTTFYGYYPMIVNTKIADDLTLSLPLPSVQTFKKNSFSANSNLAIAVTDDASGYHFKNLCGYLCVQLTGAPEVKVSSIRITAGEKTSLAGAKLYLSGSGTVDFDDYGTSAGPTFVLDGQNNGKSIELNCGSAGIALDPSAPTSFYFVVPAGTYTGIAVDLFTAGGQKHSFVKGGSGGIRVDRSAITQFTPCEVVEAATEPVIPAGDTYTVTTPAQWNWIAAQVEAGNTFEGKTVELGNDLDFAGETLLVMGSEADYMTNTIPTTTAFRGDFDGRNHTIRNLSITASGRARGLFGHVRGGTIRNVTLDGVTVGGAGKWVGALAGILTDGSIDNCHVRNVVMDVREAAGAMPYKLSYRLAGLVGYWKTTTDGCSITRCSVDDLTIHGSFSLAGLVGGTYGNGAKTISECSVDRLELHNHDLLNDYFVTSPVLGDCSADKGRIDLAQLTVGTWAIHDEDAAHDPSVQTWCSLPYVGECYPGNAAESQIYLDGTLLQNTPYYGGSADMPALPVAQIAEAFATQDIVTLPANTRIAGEQLTIPAGKSLVGGANTVVDAPVVLEGGATIENLTVSVPAGGGKCAVSAAGNNSTVTLKNVVIDQPNTGTAQGSAASTAAIDLCTAEGTAVENVVLDMADCTVNLTGSSYNHAINCFGDNVKVNIANSTFVCNRAATADDKPATYSRGINLGNSGTQTNITLTNVTMRGFYYPINFSGTATDATVVIDGGYYTGYCVLNIWTKVNVEIKNGAVLEGVNQWPAGSNDFATIVCEANSTGSKITVTDSTIKSRRNNTALEYLMFIHSENVAVKLDGTTRLIDGDTEAPRAISVSNDTIGQSFLTNLTIGDRVVYECPAFGITATGPAQIMALLQPQP